jgi:hypothetical protein
MSLLNLRKFRFEETRNLIVTSQDMTVLLQSYTRILEESSKIDHLGGIELYKYLGGIFEKISVSSARTSDPASDLQ